MPHLLFQLSGFTRVSKLRVYACNRSRFVPIARFTYFLFLSFLGNVALLHAHSSEEIPEVAKERDNAEAQVCHDSHVHRGLFVGLLPGLLGGDSSPRALCLYNERRT